MPCTSTILPTNRLGTALSPEVFADPMRPANMARFIFLTPRAGNFFADWQGIADDAVAILRRGRPRPRRLSEVFALDMQGHAGDRSGQCGPGEQVGSFVASINAVHAADCDAFNSTQETGSVLR